MPVHRHRSRRAKGGWGGHAGRYTAHAEAKDDTAVAARAKLRERRLLLHTPKAKIRQWGGAGAGQAGGHGSKAAWEWEVRRLGHQIAWRHLNSGKRIKNHRPLSCNRGSVGSGVTFWCGSQTTIRRKGIPPPCWGAPSRPPGLRSTEAAGRMCTSSLVLHGSFVTDSR